MPDTETTTIETQTISSPASAGDNSNRSEITGETEINTEGKSTTGENTNQTQTDDSQAAQVAQDEILRAARGDRTPEEELELLQAANKASQREGVRLNSIVNAVKDTLKEQGFDLVLDPKTKEFKAIVPNKSHKSDIDVPTLSYSDLSSEEKDMLADEPEKALNKILSNYSDKVRSAVSRVQPTADKVIEPVTESKLNATHDFLANRKDALGESLYDDYEKMRPLIDSFIADEHTPQWIKDAVAQNTSEALPYVHAHLKQVQNRLTRAAQKKAQQTQKQQEQGLHASLTAPEGSATAVIKEGSAEAAFISSIGKSGHRR